MNEYRLTEITNAIDGYHKEMAIVHDLEMEVLRQKQEAWYTLKMVLYADKPGMLHSTHSDEWKYMYRSGDSE